MMLFQRRVPKKVRVLKRTPKKSKLFCSATLSTKENLANSRDRQSPFAIPATTNRTPVNLVTSVTSGKTTNFVEKNAIENGFYFFTYARCRRRLPLIKMINEGEEVFVLLSFPALDYEYLFCKYRDTRFKSEVI